MSDLVFLLTGNKPLDYSKKYELNRIDCIHLERLGLVEK